MKPEHAELVEAEPKPREKNDSGTNQKPLTDRERLDRVTRASQRVIQEMLERQNYGA
jgi:hypothetical protein